ncbi:MAG TPA: redoxin domain-containing protein [Promineifilum sp.]
MPPDDPQSGHERRRLALVAAGTVSLLLAGMLLFYSYRSFAQARREPLQSIPAFQGTAQSGVAPLQTDVNGLPEAGSIAPDFALQDLGGQTVRLSDFRGRPVILNFWATWCAPCRLEMPELQKLQAAYGENGPMVLAVNQKESAGRVTEFFEDIDLDLIALLDTNTDVGAAYGAFFLPTTVIVGPDGVVAAVHRGIISREQLDGYLAGVVSAEGS